VADSDSAAATRQVQAVPGLAPVGERGPAAAAGRPSAWRPAPWRRGARARADWFVRAGPLTALGRRRGQRLTLTAEAGVVIARRDPGAMVTVPTRPCAV